MLDRNGSKPNLIINTLTSRRPPFVPGAVLEPESAPPASLFRAAALEHHGREENQQQPLCVSPPWTWSLVWLLGLFTLAALAGAFLGKVEVRSVGRGVLRPLAGVRLITAQVGGTLATLSVHNGDRLQAGQAIARIEAAQVQISILETERQLELLKGEGKGFSDREEERTRDQIRSVQAKVVSQQSLLASFQNSVAFQRKNIANITRLIAEKLEAPFKLDEANDQLNGVLRQQDAARQQLAQLQQDLTSLQSAREIQVWKHAQELGGVQAKREALESSLHQSELFSPLDGFLEALVAKPGDVIQPGQVLAKVIPVGSPLQVVAFLTEKDRADVKTGETVSLELDAFPFTEFGTLKGRVVRIGTDLASPYEIREVLGEEAKLGAPAYRVDLEILPERPLRLRKVLLQPGMQLQARFILKKQRLITLVLEPLRRWLD